MDAERLVRRMARSDEEEEEVDKLLDDAAGRDEAVGWRAARVKRGTRLANIAVPLVS